MIRKPLVVPESMLRASNPNRNEIASRISIAPGPPADLPSSIGFVFVCFTNRCGSAYLGDVLSSTGFFGQPFETLNAGNVLDYCRQHELRSFREYFERIVLRDVRNETYIVKTAPEQILLLSETGILDQVIGRSSFLFMNRVDKLAQAISLAIAAQNNRWDWRSPGGLPDDRLAYSAERISQHLRDITVLNLRFEQFFGLNGIVPITVEYERLVAAPQQELDQIASRVGLNGLTMDASRLKYRRQANEINQAWRSRFLLETSAPPEASFGVASMPRDDRPAAPGPVVAEIIRSVRPSAHSHLRLDAMLELFDEAFYVKSNSDVANGVRAGWLASGRDHYIRHGFKERRTPFALDQAWCSAQYPLAAIEVARGDYADFIHHYVAAGRERGCRPMPA
jgi:LPS sulfotransferase NodH